MNTTEAYERFKAGERVLVLVTGTHDGLTTAFELHKEAWERRVVSSPRNTNYEILRTNTLS